MTPEKGFRFKQFTVLDDQCQMKVGTDAVLLGAWVDVTGSKNILDIGTGCGVIALMLAQRTHESVRIDAVEPSLADADQAQLNARNSPWPERVAIHRSIIQEYEPLTRYDLIVSNPPFFSASLLPPSAKRAKARHTETLTHTELLDSVNRLMTEKGTLAIILPVTEGDRFIRTALNFSMYVARSLAFHTRPERKQERWLLELKRGPQPANEELITLHDALGQWSAAYHAMVKDFYL